MADLPLPSMNASDEVRFALAEPSEPGATFSARRQRA
jgi:hypothetical protein